MAKPVELKKNDLQPYYYGEVKSSSGAAVNITGATIYCTMRAGSATPKINRQTTGITITDGPNGLFEYHWQAGETDTTGKYNIEFEINPVAGGKFTVPKRPDDAIVLILEALDAS